MGATVHFAARISAVSGRKSGKLARVDLGLPSLPARQQLLPPRIELSGEAGEETQSLRRQNFGLRVAYRRRDFDPRRARLNPC